MLYGEIIAVCSQIHTKHINTLCGQNVELLNVDAVGSCVLKDYQLGYTMLRLTGGGGRVKGNIFL
jgi:hypothetical protein